MFFEHRAFWLPKDVQEPNAYEDAFDADGNRGVAAICDGVSSSLFSGRWALILAKAVVAQPPDVRSPQALEAWLKRNREAWLSTFDESTLAWHQKPKLLDGAATTLLWVELSRTGAADGVARPFRLRCFAIGDCCLFHVRGNAVLETFPLQQSDKFDNNPQIIRSVAKRSDAMAFQALETQCNPGDLLMLCSDAVGAWTMRQVEAGVDVDWDYYWEMPPEVWQQWIIDLRQQNQIRIDDSTALLLRIAGGHSRPPRAKARSQDDEDSLLDKAETKVRGALKSLKGKLRKGLRGLSESKWLTDEEQK
jgi:hypothetical protein